MPRLGRSRLKAVVPLSDYPVAAGRKETQVGVLARALSTAERCGAIVPETYVVLADVFRQAVLSGLPPGHDPGSLVRTIGRPAGVERASRARDKLLTLPFEADLEKELDEAYRALSEGAPWGLAVRASAILPDSGFARIAGLTSTELAISSRQDFGDAIRRAWSLAASERTLSYLRAKKMRDLAIAVVVQPVVPAGSHLVLVTDGRSILGASSVRDEFAADGPVRILTSSPGLGSAQRDPASAEVIHLDARGAVLFRRPAAPAPRLVVLRGKLSWCPPDGGPQAVSGVRLAEMTEVARRLAPIGPSLVRCAAPRDGEASIVDVEPLHHVGLPASGTAGTLWGRASVENGAAEPLSRLSRDLSAAPLLERAKRAMGDGAPRSSRLAGLVSPVHGRLMMNLSAIVERAPESAIERIETAGAQWAPDLAREPPPRSILPLVGLRLAQIVTEIGALSDEIGRFEREAEQQRRWLAEMDLAILPDDALTTTLAEVQDFLVRAWHLDARASAAAVSGHGLLSSVLGAADPRRAGFLAHAVTGGSDVVTGRAARALCHVAAIGRLDPEGARALSNGATEMPDGPLGRALERFLQAYGDRGLLESELLVPRFGEDPTPVHAMLRVGLAADAIDPDVVLSRVRARAERILSLLEPNLSFFEWRLCRDLASRYRELLRLRERCRVRIAHGLSMMRFVARDVDRRIRRIDPALGKDAALFLTLDELSFAVKQYSADLKPIVRSRRLDLETEKHGPSPPPCFRGSPEPTFAGADSVIRGIACGGGTGEGRARRVGPRLEGLDGFSAGDVLVVQSLDLGHAPLFFHTRAVVSELGTPSSSAALVARDCGVPVVTGITGLAGILRDGDRVAVDGDEGTVERIAP